MRSSLCLPLLLLGSLSFTAEGQFIGAGSTPQGDYLRGLGIAAAGLGSFNRDTAIADAILTDSAIRADKYMNQVLRAGRDNWVKLDREAQAKSKANYEKILKRIQDHPERLDVFTGNALNAALRQLNDPAIQPSTFRSIRVPVSREMLRRIPFKMDEKGLIFSVQRLTARGKGKWPVAFQHDAYIAERKAFDRAIDRAMEQMIDGKILPETIADYEEAVKALSTKLQAEFGPNTDRRYQDAQLRLNEMKKATNLLKTTKIQPVMAELDRYTGEDVNDLRLFMLAHGLLFAGADSADERRLFVELYASIDTVRRIVLARAKERDE